MAKQEQVMKTSLSYIQYVNALHSQKTKEKYTEFLIAFLNFAKTGCDELISSYQDRPKQLQALIISYVVDMKENKKLSPATMKVRLAAVKTYLEINDFEGINWRKVKRYIGEFYRIAEDRPYTREEIRMLLDAARSLRDKAIILLLASSGIRRGAIIRLQLKHLQNFDKYNIFLIHVYKQAKEEYYTFCTPEARKAIEAYMEWRKRVGEKLTPETILFREEFDTQFGASAKKNIVPMTEQALRFMLKRLREQTGIIENHPLTESSKLGAHRSEIATVHGFRKFFDTTCTNGGMESLFVEIVMGHDLGLKRSYFKPQIKEVLEGNDRMRGYISVINDLTINEEHRLLMKNAQQEHIINVELQELRNQIELIKNVTQKDQEQVRKIRASSNLKKKLRKR